MNAIFKKYKKKIEKDTTDKLLMGMAESFAMGINCKSNGIANDHFFHDVASALPDCKLDQESNVIFHLKSNLKEVMKLVGDDSLDMNSLSYQGIMDYICLHQKKVAGSQDTYRVIRDLFEMSHQM